MLDILKKSVHFLRNPWAIALGVFLGILVGIFFKKTAEILGPWGDLYIRFLEMTIIPIVISAVISSIGKLLKSTGTAKYLKKLIGIIVGGLFLASALGILFAIVGQPGEGLSLHSQIELGKIVTKFEQREFFEIVPEKVVSIYETHEKEKVGLFSFLTQLIPSNVFSSLSAGENTRILFFSILIGIALGFVQENLSWSLLNILSGIFLALEKIIHFALYLLPFALICLLAQQVAKTGEMILLILLKYVVLYFIIITSLFTVNLIIMWRRLKIPFFKSLQALKDPILIALGSANVYVAMPMALKALHKELYLDRTTVNLILPISISIFAFGSTCFYAFNTLFFVQLFDIPLTIEHYSIIFFGAILTSMSTVGAPVPIKLTLLSIIFSPLGIPLAPAIAILMAVKPITESFEEAWDLHTNCVLTALIAEKIPSITVEKDVENIVHNGNSG